MNDVNLIEEANQLLEAVHDQLLEAVHADNCLGDIRSRPLPAPRTYANGFHFNFLYKVQTPKRMHVVAVVYDHKEVRTRAESLHLQEGPHVIFGLSTDSIDDESIIQSWDEFPVLEDVAQKPLAADLPDGVAQLAQRLHEEGLELFSNDRVAAYRLLHSMANELGYVVTDCELAGLIDSCESLKL